MHRNTAHWLENRGTIPAVEISVDIVRQEQAQAEGRRPLGVGGLPVSAGGSTVDPRAAVEAAR